MSEPWNHNNHYHHVLLDALPRGCERALDVGCGEGAFTRKLRACARDVLGIDVDRASIEAARRADPDGVVAYLLGDFLTHPFAPASFDVVASVAALHHLDATTALQRMATLLRPGGTLAILGLARSRQPVDLPRDAAAAIVSAGYRLAGRRRRGRSIAPTLWPPPPTYDEVRRLASDVLPGSRFRRHLLWRYSLVWTKPHELTAA